MQLRANARRPASSAGARLSERRAEALSARILRNGRMVALERRSRVKRPARVEFAR